MKRFIFLAIFLSLITYGYADSNVTNINNVRDYSGFGVNFDPQLYYGSDHQASSYLFDMVNKLDQRNIALIQEMGTFADIGINSAIASNLQTNFVNDVNHAKNVKKLSFVIYSPYHNFWIASNSADSNPCIGKNANIQQCILLVRSYIKTWLHNNAKAQLVCRHTGSTIANRNCQFIIGNERFFMVASKINNHWWFNNLGSGYNDFEDMLSMPLIIDALHQELAAEGYYNLTPSGKVALPVGINHTVATGNMLDNPTKPSNKTISVGYKPVMMKDKATMQYVINYRNLKNSQTIKDRLIGFCQAPEVSVNGLVNDDDSQYINLASHWQHNAFAQYNTKYLKFSTTDSLCDYFMKVLAWGATNQYLDKIDNKEHYQINIIAAHVYPYFVQYMQNTPALATMLNQVYQPLKTYLASINLSYQLSQVFQLGETGYADVATNRSGPKASVTNQINYINDVLNTFNHNNANNKLSLVNGDKANVIFWTAFDSASSLDAAHCLHENYNMGLFYSYFPLCKGIGQSCNGQDKSLSCQAPSA
ncbi:MAG: hypothetical protein EP298_11360 [Gammaproteobacteria bacterium]|nr:MAG: hypothetical protein EP298_11360 [Gammaproteobacteria bacterium]UTW43216.1 hypothetical protein KFE69_03465 [bacterium SCSIO 12844]